MTIIIAVGDGANTDDEGDNDVGDGGDDGDDTKDDGIGCVLEGVEDEAVAVGAQDDIDGEWALRVCWEMMPVMIQTAMVMVMVQVVMLHMIYLVTMARMAATLVLMGATLLLMVMTEC